MMKILKNITLILAFFAGSFTTASAQKNGGQGDRQEKVEALYIAYITQQLSLTSDEAQKFWPVHAQFEGEIKQFATGNDELQRQQAMLDVKKKYQDKFVKVLGAERTNNFFKIDAEFRKRMADRLKKLRENKNKNR